MLTLTLSQLPATILGIYGPKENLLPQRMRYLHPDAAASYMRLEVGPHRLRVSDMFRSAESSLRARQEKRGVQPPGRSGHNFGFSIDVHVQWILETYGWSKAKLDQTMQDQGWYCHRKDHLLDSESWHYNFFGAQARAYLDVSAPFGSTAPGLERKIQDHYGSRFVLTAVEIQEILKSMRLYTGDIDGDIGPLSHQAIKAFQRAWALPETGLAGQDTQRLLAYVGAERQLVPLDEPLAA